MRFPLLRTLVLALAVVIVLSGCNTMRGVGKDVEKAGEVIQDTADK